MNDEPRKLGRPTIELIAELSSREFGLTRFDLESDRRNRTVVTARQIAMFLSLELSFRGTAAIGRALNRDHTTVLHGNKVIYSKIKTDEELRRRVNTVRRAVLRHCELSPLAPFPLSGREAAAARMVNRVFDQGRIALLNMAHRDPEAAVAALRDINERIATR